MRYEETEYKDFNEFIKAIGDYIKINYEKDPKLCRYESVGGDYCNLEVFKFSDYITNPDDWDGTYKNLTEYNVRSIYREMKINEILCQ